MMAKYNKNWETILLIWWLWQFLEIKVTSRFRSLWKGNFKIHSCINLWKKGRFFFNISFIERNALVYIFWLLRKVHCEGENHFKAVFVLVSLFFSFYLRSSLTSTTSCSFCANVKNQLFETLPFGKKMRKYEDLKNIYLYIIKP